MKPILTGDRIILRPLTSKDAPAIFASLAEPVAIRLTGTHKHFTFDDVVTHCKHIEQASDRWDYGITVDGRLIGEVVLNDHDPPNRSASFRIAIWDPAERSKGYGLEATRLIIDFGFRELDLNRIELEVYAFNPGARRTYEKAGFKLEGIKREALIWEDEKVDAELMSILRRDYSAD